MYLINTHLQGNNCSCLDDFPLLTNGRTFFMKKQGDDFIIQTTISDEKELMRLIKVGEKELNIRIKRGQEEAKRLMDYNSYTFSNISKEKEKEESAIIIYGEELYKRLKISKAL